MPLHVKSSLKGLALGSFAGASALEFEHTHL